MEEKKRDVPIDQKQDDLLEDDDSFRTDLEGMSEATAQIAIDRHIRKKLMQDYNLLELRDEGRYFVAKAISKDGLWHYELMVDKLSGIVREYGKHPVR